MDNKTSETRRYDVRSNSDEPFCWKGAWLGTFLVTHDGCITINSDYGNYSYWWNSTGHDDIREFLLRIDTSYLLGKIAPSNEYYGDETEKSIREFILKSRRDGSLTKEEARDEWDRLRDHDLSDVHGFGAWAQATDIGDAYEFAHYDSPRQAVMFTKRVWPRFCEMLREEMRLEKENAEWAVSEGRLHAKQW